MRMYSDNVLSLRFKGFDDTIKETLQELQIGNYFCDVSLACEGTQLKAHKIFLTSCRSFLFYLF